ncbi:Basal transcription factor complex subunit-related isoform 1 [Hibiscus syriacus]|uniref:Basal transcription factor complex subunit-related isoform 1 n=1 Tax=Hibiscus syriacus TaxID=106335 RepID=A0A6A3ADC6_HIBSY|nr:Basal transcription factor complex subunit-related isoform 1 [Hibiscus syriacus]
MKLWRLPRRSSKSPTSPGPPWNVATTVTTTAILLKIMTLPSLKKNWDDMHEADILINVNQKDSSWWVWVTDEMVPSNVEEWSGIDDENCVVVTEEHVVDGVVNFMEKFILSNPKAQVFS